ncbi:MAG: hypothetical protein PUC59_09475 [Firmicutes bacterium]|nr:hypothetical protein [Bacillota bacterium]
MKDWTPDMIRDFLAHHKADHEVAAVMAAVAAKSTRIGYDIDAPDNDEETNARIIAEHDAWWKLEKELYAEIIRRLEEENRTKGTAHVTGGIGLHYIIRPFMQRNGFRDAAGWWVKRKDIRAK